MKRPYAYYRYIDYTSDGCSKGQCLACKAAWEARYCSTNFCANCGIKFLGQHESAPKKPGREWRKPETPSHWVIQARRVTDDPEYKFLEKPWTSVHEPGGGAKAALTMLRAYRAQENALSVKTKEDLGRMFPVREEFRLIYTRDEGVHYVDWARYPAYEFIEGNAK